DGTATFGVTASGVGLNYQWEVNGGSGWSALSDGGVYSGVNTNKLTITGATLAMNGLTYRCVVGSVCPGTFASGSAVLTVPTPLALTQQPIAAQTICTGGNTAISTMAVGSGVTYQWYRYNGST